MKCRLLPSLQCHFQAEQCITRRAFQSNTVLAFMAFRYNKILAPNILIPSVVQIMWVALYGFHLWVHVGLVIARILDVQCDL
jgi:hypothetical protein